MLKQPGSRWVCRQPEELVFTFIYSPKHCFLRIQSSVGDWRNSSGCQKFGPAQNIFELKSIMSNEL